MELEYVKTQHHPLIYFFERDGKIIREYGGNGQLFIFSRDLIEETSSEYEGKDVFPLLCLNNSLIYTFPKDAQFYEVNCKLVIQED